MTSKKTPHKSLQSPNKQTNPKPNHPPHIPEPKTKKQSHKLTVGSDVILIGTILKIDPQSNTTWVKLSSSPSISKQKHTTISISNRFLHSKQQYISQDTNTNNKCITSPEPEQKYNKEPEYKSNDNILLKPKIYFDTDTTLNDKLIHSMWSELNTHVMNAKIFETDASQKCNAWFFNDCFQTQRILFILQYYQKWIHNHRNPSQNQTLQTMTNFIDTLSGYSQQQLWNDFHHIRLFHIVNNNNNNNNMDNIYEYFRKHLKHFKKINIFDLSLKRQTIDKEKLREMDWRRELYLINDNIIGEKELFEMNIQRLLDTIHCTLVYHDIKNMKYPKRFILSNRIEVNRTTGKSEELVQTSDEGSSMIGEYGLGINISYWNSSWPIHCDTKYTNLKEELFTNKWYKLDECEYNLMYKIAKIFLLTLKGKSMIANSNGGWNKICNIFEGKQITIEHVLVLMLYTNIPKLMELFGNTYVAQHHGENRKNIIERHSEIAIYGRLLSETVAFYSERLTTENTKFYLAFDFKVPFSKWQAVMYCPISVTSNKYISYKYTLTNPNGVILSFTKVGKNGSLYFDNSYFSDTPNEDERLLMLSSWNIDNVIYNGLSCKYYVECLKLFRKIISGSFVCNQKELFKQKYQNTLIKMMENYIKNKSKQEMKYKDIPLYMQELFIEECDYGINYIWINKSEFSKCIDEFQSYFKNINSNWWKIKTTVKYGRFASYLHKIGNKNIQIVTPPEIEWKINGINLESFWKNNRIDGPIIKCNIGHVIKKTNYNEIIDEEKENKNSNCIILYPQINRHSKYNHDNKFKFEIDIKSKPEYIDEFFYEVQWEIPQINYTFDGTHKSNGNGVYYNNLFDSNQLRKFKNGFVLNIIIKIISCKDKNGNDIQKLPKN